MIKDVELSYLKFAENVKDYEKLSCQELADKFLDAQERHEELEVNSYYATLVIKNRVVIYKLKASLFFLPSADLELCYDWLIDGINYALKYKKWKDPTSPLYKDKKGFDTTLNVAISSLRNTYLSSLNTSKNKVNTLSSSLDELKENIGFEPSSKDIDLKDIYRIINDYIYNGEYLKAIIVDKIVFSDVYCLDMKCNSHYSTILLINQLYDLDDRYTNYFYNKYNRVNKDALVDIYNKIKSHKRRTVSMYVKKFIDSIREDLQEKYYA